MKRYSVDDIKRIYDEQSGEYIEVGQDLEGLGLFEIRSYNDEKLITSITFDDEQLELIINALQEIKAIKTKKEFIHGKRI